MLSSLETALSQTAAEIRAKHESPVDVEIQRINVINIALKALEESFYKHPEFIIPDQKAVYAYSRDFQQYLDAQLINALINWPITTHVDTKESQVSHKCKGTDNVIVGNKPTLVYQVWVELKDRQIHIYWKKVTY